MNGIPAICLRQGCGLTAGPRTEGEVGKGKGREAWTSGSGVEVIKTCVNILQLNR